MTFDYFHLHHSCWKLLLSIKDTCADSLRQIFGPEYLTCETELPNVVVYLFMCAFSAGKMSKDSATGPSGKVFLEAAEAIEGMIKTGRGSIGAKLMEEFYGYAVDWDDFEDEEDDTAT